MDENYNNDSNDKKTNEVADLVKSTLKRKLILKLILILGPTGFLIFIFIVIIAVLISLDLIGDNISFDSGLSFTDFSSSKYWWPIGGSEIKEVNGVRFATGNPTTTRITSYFGSTESGIHDNGHGALDIAAAGVHYIIAAKSGKVIYPKPGDKIDYGVGSINTKGYGNYVILEHDDGNYTIYGHMLANSIPVVAGQKVSQGQIIGQMGSSGNSTGQHLHFEIRALSNNKNNRVDPLNYVSVNNPRPKDSSSDLVTITGNDNTQTVCMSLKNYGYSDNAVAAIMGNMKAESGFKPVNTNSIGCDGIVQWCFGRLTNLKNTYGQDWKLLDSQLSYVVYELNNHYKPVNNYLKGSNSASDMAYYFCMKYEIPGESICSSGKRQSYANSFLPYVKNGCK